MNFNILFKNPTGSQDLLNKVYQSLLKTYSIDKSLNESPEEFIANQLHLLYLLKTDEILSWEINPFKKHQFNFHKLFEFIRDKVSLTCCPELEEKLFSYDLTLFFDNLLQNKQEYGFIKSQKKDKVSIFSKSGVSYLKDIKKMEDLF